MHRIDYLNSFGIYPNDLYLFHVASTHPSYAHEKGLEKDNQRLEFFGDSVIDMIISEYLLYQTHKDEGALTKIRASLVKKNSLYHFAKKIKLYEFMRVAKNENKMLESTLADGFEAFIGALYLDQGLSFTKDFLIGHFEKIIQEHVEHIQEDYKTILQEHYQKQGCHEIVYKTTHVSGPAHDRLFEVVVLIDGQEQGTGEGKRKKIAQEAAAKEALEKIKKCD